MKKSFLFMFYLCLLLISLNFVSAYSTENLTHYFNFESNTTHVIDRVVGSNSTLGYVLGGAYINTTAGSGKFGGCAVIPTFNSNTQVINFSVEVAPYENKKRCIAMWFQDVSATQQTGSYNYFVYGLQGVGNGESYAWTGDTSPADKDKYNLWGIDVSFDRKRVVTNTWKLMVSTYDGTTLTHYDNTTAILSSAKSLNTKRSAKFTIGYIKDFGVTSMDFRVDEMAIFNTSCSADFVAQLYNGGAGFNPFPTITSNPIVINNLSLVNVSSGVDLGDSFISEFNFFYPVVNVSMSSGYVDTNLSCFLKGNFSAEYLVQQSNYTLTSSNNFSFSFNSLNIDVRRDRYTFRVCALDPGAFGGVDIFINDNLTKNIPYTSIPLCTNGFHDEVNITNVLRSNQTITIKGNSLTSKTLRLISRDFFGLPGVILDYDREFYGNKTFNLTYNSSSKLYEYKNTFLGLDVLGSNNITVNCNNTNSTRLVFAGSFVPVVNIIEWSINGSSSLIPFVNNSVIESSQNISILCDSYGGGIYYRNISVMRGSDSSIVGSALGEFLVLNSSQLNKDGNYSITCCAINLNGTNCGVNNVFRIMDSVIPQSIWWSPAIDNSTSYYVNNTIPVQITMTDLNLWGFNISCYSSVLGFVLQTFRTNLTSPVYYYSNVSVNITVPTTVVCSLEVCDSHTVLEWSAVSPSFSKDKRNISLNNQVIFKSVSSTDIDKIEFIQRKDRLSWSITYLTFGEELSRSFIPVSFELPKSENWMVTGVDSFASWDSKRWIDFVSPNFKNVKITEFTDKFLISGEMTGTKTLIFNSVGGLNCITEVVSVQVSVPPSIPEVPTDLSIQDTSTGKSIIILALVLLYGILLIFGVLFNLDFIIYGATLFGIVLGFVIYPYSFLLCAVFIIVNAGVLLSVLIFKKS